MEHFNPACYTFSGRRFNQLKEERAALAWEVADLRAALSTCKDVIKSERMHKELLFLQECMRVLENQLLNFITVYGGMHNIRFPIVEPRPAKQFKAVRR
jgi:hypothetical protein